MMISDLPRDLESDILSRVHSASTSKLRSTWRMRSALKGWNTLFKDPTFANKLAKATKETILVMNSKVSPMSHINLKSRKPIMKPIGKLKSRVKVSEVFICNGLLLCTLKGNPRLVVRNPWNGQTRWVKPRTCYRSNDFYAVGYDNTQSYKILRFCRYNNYEVGRSEVEFEMYEFSTDSWRVLDVDTHNWRIESPGVSLKGNAYWIAKENKHRSVQFILSFDFTKERFGCVPLPYRSVDSELTRSGDNEDMAVLSVVGDGKLSVLRQMLHKCSLGMKIWVSREIVDNEQVSWSKFLKVEFGVSQESIMNVVSFLLDEEKKRALCCTLDMDDHKRARLHVVGRKIEKAVYDGRRSRGSWPQLLSYVPSLVDIEKKTLKCNRKRKTVPRPQAFEEDAELPMRRSTRRRTQIDNYFP